MDIVAVQDAQREIDLASRFELLRGGSRIGVDATDEFGNEFELKTTTKKSVSTARDLGPKHIAKWRNRYWIIARGSNTKNGFHYDRIYFLAPVHMAGWYEEMENRFSYDVVLASKVNKILLKHLDTEECDRINRMLDRGMLLNDPNISWKYVQDNGIDISHSSAEDLRDLVKQFPVEACLVMDVRDMEF